MAVSNDGTRETLLTRHISDVANEYLDVFRVVVLNGPRQAGKTTLMRQLVGRRGGELRNLDQEALLTAARNDPAGFTVAGTRPLYIDEVQRGGDALIREVKARADSSRAAGQFVLAGSMRFLAVPSLHESLAGRAGVLAVWPFSQGEMVGRRETFLDQAFNAPDRLRSMSTVDYARNDYLEMAVRGGFPEPCRISSRRARGAWFANYVRAVAERDIREMARINQPSAAQTVLRGLASMSGQLLVTNTLATRAELPRATVDRYTGLLEALFLVQRLPSWSRNLLNQAVKHPKVHLVDTGLLCHLLGETPEKLGQPTSTSVGSVIETFLATEIFKQSTWAEADIRLHHYRDGRGHGEIDLIAEDDQGRVVALEAKAAETVSAHDFRQLVQVRERLGRDFVHGFVAYLGRNILRFGDRLTAIPLGLLWTAVA